MTTIAYRNGVMAADSGVWNGDACMPWARKLVKGRDGILYGTAGNAAQCQSFLEWVEGGYRGDQPKPNAEKEGSSFLVLSVAKGGPVKLITATGTEVYDAPYFAIGGGNVGALCALYTGASAEEAIAAAIAHAAGAIGPVQSIRHE